MIPRYHVQMEMAIAMRQTAQDDGELEYTYIYNILILDLGHHITSTGWDYLHSVGRMGTEKSNMENSFVRVTLCPSTTTT